MLIDAPRAHCLSERVLAETSAAAAVLPPDELCQLTVAGASYSFFHSTKCISLKLSTQQQHSSNNNTADCLWWETVMTADDVAECRSRDGAPHLKRVHLIDHRCFFCFGFSCSLCLHWLLSCAFFFHPLVTYLCLVSMISHYIILSECITVLISCRQSMFDRLIGIDCPRWSIADRFPVSSCCCFFLNQWYPHLLLIYCPPPQKYIQCSAVSIRGRGGNFICRFGVFWIALRFVFAFSPPNLSKCLFEFIFLVWKSRPFSTTRLLLLLLSSLTGMCVFSLREVGKLAHWLIDWAQW